MSSLDTKLRDFAGGLTPEELDELASDNVALSEGLIAKLRQVTNELSVDEQQAIRDSADDEVAGHRSSCRE